MSHRSEILPIVCLFLALTSYAQQPTSVRPGGVATAESNIPTHGTGSGARVSVSVVDDKTARFGRPAMARIYDENLKTSNWQPVAKNSEVTFDDLGLGKYDFQVSSIGYLTARKEVEITNARQPIHLQLSLVPDPDAVQLNPPDASTPAKATKDAERGISELEAGKFKDGQKHLESALKEAPSSSQVNFLLGYSYFQQNDFDQAQTYVNKATTLDPHNIQAFNLSGRLHLAKRDYAGAKTVMEQAVAADPENAAAHGILADAYLNLSDYKNALAQADLSIEKSKSGISSAHIVRGQALADLGREDEAIQTLKAYLQNAPDSASGPQVQQFIAALEARNPKASSTPPPPTKQ
jgi:tetratricopeptide (TPR) repeat protein